MPTVTGQLNSAVVRRDETVLSIAEPGPVDPFISFGRQAGQTRRRANGECKAGTAAPEDPDLTFRDNHGRAFHRGADRELPPVLAAVGALTDQPVVPANHDRAIVREEDAPAYVVGEAGVHCLPYRAVVAGDQSAGPHGESQIISQEGNAVYIAGHSGIHGRP